MYDIIAEKRRLSMTFDDFKILHSELIMHMQCIENDLKIIYAAMKPGNFDKNYDELEKSNLGQITRVLKRLDYSDGYPDLLPEDYRTIDRIRETRNYWCHQCYLDFIYLTNCGLQEEKLREIAERLSEDTVPIRSLREKLQNLRMVKLKEYHRI